MNDTLDGLGELIIERVGVGIFVLDRDLTVLKWNGFMRDYSGLSAEQVVGRSIFDCFPELPRPWMTRKVESVFELRSFAFSSWEQRPYLFKFDHDRPITGGVDFMQQDCTFIPLTRGDEIVAVCVTIHDVTHVRIMHHEREKAVATLQDYANLDGLTGIANRRYFESRRQEALERLCHVRDDLSLLLFDLDHFKQINDRHGHLIGDQALQEVARRVSPLVRNTDTFARFGGEEFVLLLSHTPLDEAMQRAEMIRGVIGDAPFEFPEANITVTVSIGAASLRCGGTSGDSLMRDADAALYRAKREGRNRSVAAG